MEGYSRQKAVLSFAWFILWVGLGTYFLYEHNLVLPYIYFGYAALMYLAYLYFACTRCFYFKKPCYLLGGLIAPAIFRARKEGPKDPDDSIASSLLLILCVFPIPFLIYYQNWSFLIVYSVVTYGWVYFRKRFICKKCKSEWCTRK